MMVNRRACPVEGCDTRVDALTHDGDLACDEHDEPLEFVGKAGCVRGLSEGQMPVDPVRELAEEWRESEIGAAEACADELEQLADDLEGEDG